MSHKFNVFWYSIILAQIIGNFLSFFWRNISFFRYFFFMLICNCFWIILLQVLKIFVILPSKNLATTSKVLLPIKSPVASAIFWIAIFEANLSASVVDCSVCSRCFWLYLPVKVCTYIFTNIFIHIFGKIQNSIAFYKYPASRLNWTAHHFLYFTLN